MMNFEIRVVEPAAFKTYLEARIAGDSNAEALKAINEEPLAITTKPFDTRRGERVMPKPETAAAQATK
jgi:cytochrome c oxidase subunit 2